MASASTPPRLQAWNLRANMLSPATSDAQGWLGFGQSEEDMPTQASFIFSDAVSLRVKPAGREEYVANVTVRLQPDNMAHPRSLLLELTDESDLFFYHSLLLGEGDFHNLKSEQRLLVDFQAFPSQLVELLRRCMDTAASPSGAARSSTSSLSMLACLDCSSGGESTFSIVESNQLRELTYIALKLQKGSDETVKKHLAAKLRLYRTESADLSTRLIASEEAVGQLRKQVEELTARARVVHEERTHLEQSLDTSHQRELAELRQEHARVTIEFQQTANQERSRIEADAQQALAKMTARAEKAERSNDELQQQQITLTTSGKSFRERLEASDAELQEARQENKTVREQLKQLELLKFQHERDIGEKGVRLSALQEQLANKEQLLTNQLSQLEQSAAQRKSVEDALAVSSQQVGSLEVKFGLSAQEISKGNEIIQKLRGEIKQLKAKVRLKAEALTQQQKSVVDLGRAEETGRHMVEEKAQELLRSKEREERQRQDIEDLKKKLAEAHEVLKNNHDVIEYLNKQLTERELKALPPVSGGLATSSGDARSSALTDLLKRTEGLGRGLSPAGLRAGSAFSPSTTSFNLSGLAEMGLGSSGARGYGGSGTGPGFSSPARTSALATTGLLSGASGMSPGSLTTSGLSSGMPGVTDAAGSHHILGFTSPGASSASAAASVAAGRDPLSGPVTYRSPTDIAPITVR